MVGECGTPCYVAQEIDPKRQLRTWRAYASSFSRLSNAARSSDYYVVFPLHCVQGNLSSQPYGEPHAKRWTLTTGPRVEAVQNTGSGTEERGFHSARL